VYQITYRLLVRLEGQLKHLDLWESQHPPAAALASEKPFAIDSLDFHQWLQFIFLPRMHALVEGKLPLPDTIGVSPMAAQVYKNKLDQYHELIAVLREIDMHLSGKDPLTEDHKS